MKRDFTILEGEVVECLPNTTFRVKLFESGSPKDRLGLRSAEATTEGAMTKPKLDKEGDNSVPGVKTEGKMILCHLSGKMRINRIRVIPGDKVKVAVTPYDETRGRIVYRMK